MKKDGLLLLPVLFILLTNIPSFGQLDYPIDFKNELQMAQLNFYEPLENSFKSVPIDENELIAYDFAIKSKDKKVEIRYAILPASEQAENFVPTVNFAAKATSLATNEEEDALMVFHLMDANDLQEQYNADWGASVFFRPKAAFSNKKHCRMLALYAEGKANVFVFYLFNDLSIDLNEPQFKNIRFNESLNE